MASRKLPARLVEALSLGHHRQVEAFSDVLGLAFVDVNLDDSPRACQPFV